MSKLKEICHDADVCVVGGGLGGMMTAISAARQGARVALMHDRPVLGGNASSEIRMWISGAGTRVPNLMETGIIEEMIIENMYRNPSRNWSIWDSVLYEMVRFEKNIDLILNCTCNDADMQDGAIKSVRGFQLTTYTWHTVCAKLFVDCSGDSILSTLTGAEFRLGRESKKEYGEEFAVDVADNKTMGMSLMLTAREMPYKTEYIPPKWAYTFKTEEDMKFRPLEQLTKLNTNYYWIELGGDQDQIGDTESIRDEELRIAFGVWDHIKNQKDYGADNWQLEWVGFLPGKRESRRYVGDYTLTQQDVVSGGHFDDEVAYGGWQIDDHKPGGFKLNYQEALHKLKLTEPYGIPYRCLYSVNIPNLMFAGRNISASHIAFSSTRVMATIALMGQAVGTAAAMAVREGLTPRQVGEQRIRALQAQLMEDDCFLPHIRREIAALSRRARLTAEDGGDVQVLHNGIERTIWGEDNGYYCQLGHAITYTFDKPEQISCLTATWIGKAWRASRSYCAFP